MSTYEAPEALVVKRSRLGDGAWAVTLRIDDGSAWEQLGPEERAARETVHTFYADHQALNGGHCDPERWLRDRKASTVARFVAMRRIAERMASLE